MGIAVFGVLLNALLLMADDLTSTIRTSCTCSSDVCSQKKGERFIFQRLIRYI